MPIDDVLKGIGYKVISEIGAGSYSKVKLAASKKHRCNVAIKIVDRGKACKDFVQTFLPRELAILRRVNHEHIVQIHEFIRVADKLLCIVMEAAEKDLLKKIHEVKRISEEHSKNLFSQMVSAIHYLHQMDIIHRDLKCENILLTAEEQVKIADFGFARFVKNPSELCQSFCGSAAYTPPEVINGTPYEPKKYDIWSLGVILYIMVTGSLPYDDTNLTRFRHLQQKPLTFLDDAGVQEPCKVFICTLLELSPFTRPTIQQVAEHPWMQQGKS